MEHDGKNQTYQDGWVQLDGYLNNVFFFIELQGAVGVLAEVRTLLNYSSFSSALLKTKYLVGGLSKCCQHGRSSFISVMSR